MYPPNSSPRLVNQSTSPTLRIKQYNADGTLIHEDTMVATKQQDDSTPVDPKIASPQEKAIASLAALSYRTGELQSYLNQICKAVLDVLGDGAAAITLYRNGKKNVIAREPHSPKVGVPLDVHGHLSTFVVDRGEILRVDDALKNPAYGNPPAGYCSYLGIPLKLPNGEVVGTLCYFDEAPRHYTDNDEQVASLFAERVAIALDNYELYLQLKEHSENLEQIVEQRSQELLRARDALAQKEKLAAIGEFATRLTHEIRNPLATIRLALEYFDRQGDERASKRAQLAGSEVSRLERMLNEVLVYARPAQIEKAPIALNDFLHTFLAQYQSYSDDKELQNQVTIQASPTVLADADKLTQVCLNLYRNACEAAEPGQTIRWTLSEIDDNALLQIENSGARIPPEKLEKITEAFISGKPNGTGLGLAIAKSLIEAHQGSLHIQSADDSTLVTLQLPKSR